MAGTWFSIERLQEELTTAWLGRAARVVEETGSTIDVAWSWLKEGGPDGGVVVAQRQTQGRGRLGRAWASPAGGLWMSVIARPEIESRHVGRLGIIAGLAAAESVSQMAEIAVGLKWPNDLVAEGRKLGGVLVEARVAASRIRGAVVSVGLNVNLRTTDFPDEIRETATSVLAITGREFPLESVAAAVLNQLEPMWAEELGGGPFDRLRLARRHAQGVAPRRQCGPPRAQSRGGRSLAARWRARDVLLGRDVVAKMGGEALRGVADGIDDEGRLLLRIGSERRTVTAGEVSLVEALA
jgi:BirA family biotin operon repressor/biotin-[acetyl-CoA-carboxylase] ligase